eukprot:TRINITY_DN75751_c0_g1_i1.p1 TRINITY_DN75751_c0_g1~~TRINITY_DN75751_c0_g1_i1.p1  ORF type:complete len:459 (-),score=37.12 TRINITY_DN75751_c0_g1_i1:266-1642(-)
MVDIALSSCLAAVAFLLCFLAFLIRSSKRGAEASSRKQSTPENEPTTRKANASSLLRLAKPEEVEQLQALRDDLRAELALMPPYEDVRGDRRLLRFLQGNGTVEAAARAFREQLKWRVKEGVDAIRDSVESLPWSMTAHPELAEECKRICKILPFYMDEQLCTSEGHLLWLELSARLDIQAFSQIQESEFKRLWFSLMELRSKTLDDSSVRHDRLIKVVQIRDMRGLTRSFCMAMLRNVRILSRLKLVIDTSMNAHPESINTLWFLNVPGFFPPLWAKYSYFMNEHMARKVRMIPFPHDPRILVEIGGLATLLSISRLAAEGLPCPGSSTTQVPAGSFVDLAVQLKAGDKLRWDWTGADVPFALMEFKEICEGVGSCDIVSSELLGSHSGVHFAASSSVCLFRWSNVRSWRGSKRISYTISIHCASDEGIVGPRHGSRTQSASRRKTTCHNCFVSPCT